MNEIIKTNLNECETVFEHLYSESDYDAEKLSYAILHQLKQLDYFYCKMSKDESSIITYKPKYRPKEGMIAYFNLGRGFPKELMDGHWCYILKDFGSKMLVIPCTSIKDNSKSSRYELDIINYNKNIKRKSRLQFTEIRCLDVQRIYTKKNFYNVSDENRQKIIKTFINILFQNRD